MFPAVGEDTVACDMQTLIQNEVVVRMLHVLNPQDAPNMTNTEQQPARDLPKNVLVRNQSSFKK